MRLEGDAAVPLAHPHHPGFDALDADALARRPGVKWARVRPGVLPAWVADMDFPPCPAVAQRLLDLIGQGDLGYPDWYYGTPLRAAFARRMADRYGWEADAGSVRELVDLVQGVQMLLQLATEPGDAVALHVPAYPPFLAAEAMGRRLVPIPMLPAEGRWGFDVAAMDDAVAASRARVLLLVNPHNPTGRVFTRTELEAIADTARRHDLLVISDEIHADLTYPAHQHLPFATVGADAAARTVTLSSASKAFNLAGLRCAVVHLGPERLLRQWDAQPPGLFGTPNLFGVHAALAAWSPDGDRWLQALVEHLDLNRRRVGQFVAQRLPGAVLAPPEGTYLAWLDVRGLHLELDPYRAFLRCGVRLSPGPDFGPDSRGFVRLNFATSAELLEELLTRMARVAEPDGDAPPAVRPTPV